MFGFGKKESADRHLRVILYIGNSPRHCYFANRLAEHFTVVGVLSETTRPHLLAAIAEKHPLVRLHYSSVFEKELQYFGKDKRFNIHKNDLVILPYAQFNITLFHDFVSKRDPHYIIAFDVSPLTDTFLSTFSGRILHLHNGLVNYYDGDDANFWPIIDGHPECVGMTLHRIEDTADHGLVLGQIRPELAGEDTSEDVELKAVLAGTHLAIEGVKAYHAKRLTPHELDRSDAIIHKMEDLKPDIILKAKEAIAHGLMQTFVEHRAKLYRETPIANL